MVVVGGSGGGGVLLGVVVGGGGWCLVVVVNELYNTEMFDPIRVEEMFLAQDTVW